MKEAIGSNWLPLLYFNWCVLKFLIFLGENQSHLLTSISNNAHQSKLPYKTQTHSYSIYHRRLGYFIVSRVCEVVAVPGQIPDYGAG
ncbi:MAG TPA: hypothetical protein VN038_09045, partial [Dyadobacter sp.]|nr:hypothetical protein [Dyadobacter sp.]